MPAAVPNYVGSDFSDCPPGHRFRLYFEGWDEQTWTLHTKLKQEALEGAASVPSEVLKACRDLLARRKMLIDSVHAVHAIDAVTDSPLATGMGMAHAIENGFTFLDPHGVPVLPGSSVKGALRHAAEDLVLFNADARGWTMPDVWYLFGFDRTSAYVADVKRNRERLSDWHDALRDHLAELDPAKLEWMRSVVSADVLQGRSLVDFMTHFHELDDGRVLRYRGALECWDALMVPPKSGLRVDIMNPHFAVYYKGTTGPSDDGQPKPINFLAVAPNTSVHFAFRYRPLLPEPAGLEWRELVDTAWDHAATWLGFGAKTAVGYGRMCRAGAKQSANGAHGSGRSDSPRTIVANEETWAGCTVQLNASDGSLTVRRGDRSYPTRGAAADAVRKALSPAHAERLKKKRVLQGVSVVVRVEGNMVTLLRILETP